MGTERSDISKYDRPLAEAQPNRSSTFTYVVSTPSYDASLQKEIKTLVRKHVMRDIGKSRRGRRPGSGQEVPGLVADNVPQATNFRPTLVHLQEVNGIPTMPVTAQPLIYQLPSPVTVLGAGRMDPFDAYPIRMDSQAHKLVDHIWDNRPLNLQPFRTFWFSLGLVDSAAMHQVLSNAALSLNALRGTHHEDSVSLEHHSSAILSVSRRLQDPVQGVSDGILGGILGFMCHDHIVCRLDRWNVHLSGFEHILKARGGLHTIESNRSLRLSLFWIEHNVCSDYDMIPRYVPPYQYLPILREPPEGQPYLRLEQLEWTRWGPLLMNSPLMIDIVNDLSKLNTFLFQESQKRSIWKDPDFVGFWIYPVLHKLLVGQIPALSIKQEVLRLGAILFIAQIRRNFCVQTVITVVQANKLKAIIQSDDSEWNEFQPLRTWALFMAGITASCKAERIWVIKALKTSNLACSWNDNIGSASRLWWLDEVFSTRSTDFENEFNDYLHIF